MSDNIVQLKKLLDNSRFTVALCGSGMTEEGGFIAFKKPERAYEIELEYGASPEEIFSSSYYNTRPAQFFSFYEKEVLSKIPEPGEAGRALAAMEKAGKLQAIITSNIFDQARRAGCQNVIGIHGNIFRNRCPRCGAEYQLQDMRVGGAVPKCRYCHSTIRPQICLYGEMVDSQVMTKTTEVMEKADTMLLLGTNLKSEVFSNYIRYFNGKQIAIVHKDEHFLDEKADVVIIDEPGRVLSRLGYEKE